MSFIGPLEDRLEIRELLDSYADASIRHDIDHIADCWCDDSLWCFELGVFQGKNEIRKALFGLKDQYGGLHRADIRFYTSTLGSIHIDKDIAFGRSYATIFSAVSGTSISSEIFGVYDDKYIKLDGKWLFKSRNFKTLNSKSFTKKSH
jgi:ketosteroid isomerase-like protein